MQESFLIHPVLLDTHAPTIMYIYTCAFTYYNKYLYMFIHLQQCISASTFAMGSSLAYFKVQTPYDHRGREYYALSLQGQCHNGMVFVICDDLKKFQLSIFI